MLINTDILGKKEHRTMRNCPLYCDGDCKWCPGCSCDFCGSCSMGALYDEDE